MEANQKQVVSESKSSSSEETDRSDQSNNNDDMVGTGRSYECVFCKRGFTTAQALGGHMNIHRKDRAKSRPNIGKFVDHHHHHHENNYASLRTSSYCYPPPIQSYQPHYNSIGSEVHHVSYHQAFFPTCNSGNWGLIRPPLVENNSHQHLINPFGEEEDWPTSRLSLQIGPSHLDDHDHENKNKTDHGSSDDQEDEIDLELRL